MPYARPAFAVALTLGLAGCLHLDNTALREAPKAVGVTKALVVVAGPPGFCVDPRASRNGDDSAFVLLGSCAAISNAPLAPQPDLPVVLTASVSTSTTTGLTPAAWDDYFRSEAGRAKLSARGRADEVEILATRARGNAFYLYARNKVGGRGAWRGIVTLGGAVVTLSLRATGRETLSPRARFALLDAFGDRLLAVNRNHRLSAKGARQ